MTKYVMIYRLSIYMKPGAFTSSRRELCPTRAAKKNAAPVKTGSSQLRV
jgi:hypothetical protein